jgi:sulfur transfer complex TusBCD TusB component (DsrH family)
LQSSLIESLGSFDLAIPELERDVHLPIGDSGEKIFETEPLSVFLRVHDLDMRNEAGLISLAVVSQDSQNLVELFMKLFIY